jgi:HD superfamily phosphohydrolase
LSVIEKKLSDYGKESVVGSKEERIIVREPEVNKSISLLPPIRQSINYLEEDCWSKIAEYEARKHREELRQLLLKEKEKKQKVMEDLNKQIEDKDNRKKLEKSVRIIREQRVEKSNLILYSKDICLS